MDSPVDSLPTTWDAELNTGAPRRYDESLVDPYPAPNQSELDGTVGNDTNDMFELFGLSVINAEHDDSRDTVVMKSPAQYVSAPSPGPCRVSESQCQPPPSDNNLFQSIQEMCKVTREMRDTLGSVQHNLHAQINVAISDIRTDADQRSADMREIISNVECKMMNEMRDRLSNVESNMAQRESTTQLQHSLLPLWASATRGIHTLHILRIEIPTLAIDFRMTRRSRLAAKVLARQTRGRRTYRLGVILAPILCCL